MDSVSSTKRFFFDITDIVSHFRRHRHLTGVQRVAINLIRDLSERYGHERIRCMFFHPHRRCVYECSSAFLFEQPELDGELLLYRLGAVRNWRCFPSDLRVKNYLVPYKNEKWRKNLKKAQVYGCALLRPSWLRARGLHRMSELFAGVKPIPVCRLGQVDAGDSVVLLGGGIPAPQPLRMLAQTHSRHGEVATLVHDVIAYRHPEYFPAKHAEDFNAWLIETTTYTNYYWCSSHSTARDLSDFLQAQGVASRISVIPFAHELSSFARNAHLTGSGSAVETLVRERYVLCVGTIEIRKNGALLLQAWIRLIAELGNRVPLLVFAGKRGWLIEQFDAVLSGNAELQRKVRIVEAPVDSELAALYGNCLFSVFVSLYEGWGLPIGEAAWFGKYCIASNTSSMPEICGDLMDYVDPTCLDSLVYKLRHAILNPDYVLEREERIKRAPLRTWRDVAGDVGRLLRA